MKKPSYSKAQKHRVAYCVVSPKGKLLLHTLSGRPQTAKKRILTLTEQRYHGLVDTNFQKWEEAGYWVARVVVIRDAVLETEFERIAI